MRGMNHRSWLLKRRVQKLGSVIGPGPINASSWSGGGASWVLIARSATAHPGDRSLNPGSAWEHLPMGVQDLSASQACMRDCGILSSVRKDECLVADCR